MKKFLLAFAVLTVIAYQYEHSNWRHLAEDPSNPDVIANPVYAEVKAVLETGGRSYDEVILVKAVDPADCDKVQRKLETVYGSDAVKAGQNWKIKSSECTVDLEARYLKLFDNRPTFLTYLSMGRGDRLAGC